MKKLFLAVALLVISMFFCSSAFPLIVVDPDWTVPDYDGGNGYSAFQATGLYEFNDPDGPDNASVGVDNLLDSPPYDATGRAAFFIGNDMQDDGEPTPSNIGQAGDGILNGDEQYWAIKDKNPQEYYQFDGYEFIEEFQAIDPDGIENDPGWIHLGTQEGDVNGSETDSNNDGIPDFDYDKAGDIDIGSIIDISFEYDLDDDKEIIGANWTLTPKDGILEVVEPLLGANFFDHLAVVLKSSDYFAIYDLDFNKIFALEGLSEEFFVPSQITGTLNNSDLTLNNGNGQAISHISFWAHDPVAVNDVPEPSTLILLGAGLAGLSFYTRRRRR